MNIGIKHSHGVTLFEMLLVLMVIGLIMMSVIRFADNQRDHAVAKVMGENLYTYGQAAQQYMQDNMTTIRSQGSLSGVSPVNGVYTFHGMSWLQPGTANPNPDPLKTKPYLATNFSFDKGMLPLFVGPAQGQADANITTTIAFSDPNDAASPLAVQIKVPILYKMLNTGSLPMPAVSENAAVYANEYYVAATGGSEFIFTYTPPANGNFAGTFITGVLSNNTQTDQYLRTDGTNYMKQNIVFYDPDDNFTFAPPLDPTTRNIQGIKRIFFDSTPNHAPTGIMNIDTILFNSSNPTQKTIQNVDSITFDTVNTPSITSLAVIEFSGVGSTVDQVQSINFISGSVAGSAIAHLNSMSFDSSSFGGTSLPGTISFGGNDGVIGGMKTLNFTGNASTADALATLNVDTMQFSGYGLTTVSTTGRGPDKSPTMRGIFPSVNQYYYEGHSSMSGSSGGQDLTSSIKSICYISRMRVGNTDSSQQAECRVTEDTTNSVWRLQAHHYAACEATCVCWEGPCERP